MTVNEDAERMKQLLTEAITVLCKSGFNFSSQFCVEGLLGITFDSKDIVLINIKETVKVETDVPETKSVTGVSKSSVHAGQKKRKRLKTSDSLSGSDNDDAADVPTETDDDIQETPSMGSTEDIQWPNIGKRRRNSPRQRRILNKDVALKELNVEIERAKREPTEKDDTLEDSMLLGFDTSQQDAESQKSPTISPDASSLPEAVKRFSVGDLRRIVVSLVTSEVPEGIGYPGWGKPETKPTWWPTDVPWTKWGVQRGIKRFQLEKLVTEAMSYHGGKLPEPKEKKTLKSPTTRRIKVPEVDPSGLASGVDVLEFNDGDMTVQVVQEGQQTLLVTAQPVNTIAGNSQEIKIQHQE